MSEETLELASRDISLHNVVRDAYGVLLHAWVVNGGWCLKHHGDGKCGAYTSADSTVPVTEFTIPVEELQ